MVSLWEGRSCLLVTVNIIPQEGEWILARTSNFCLDAHQAGVHLGTDILSETPREVSAQGHTPLSCAAEMCLPLPVVLCLEV